MRNLLPFVLLALMATGPAAQAFDIKPIEATPIELGDVEGVAYFDMVGEQCRLVATVAQAQGTPIQITALLADKEQLTISVPGPVGFPAQEIGFVHKNGVVEVVSSGTPGN